MNPGTLIAGKYRLEAVIGQGGMGSVWRAEHTGLAAPVAVKLMDPSMLEGEELLSRFQREAHAAARLRSPHVVQVLDHGTDEESGQPFIVMELLEGEALSRALRRGPLGLAQTTQIVEQIASALSRAHEQGIVHRDLKPDNIFLVREGNGFYVKVLDFGVAKAELAYRNSAKTRTGTLLGTPAYMSPEQIVGDKDLDARSDLWSLGVIACECVTGRRPFQAETVGAMALAICTEPIPRASALGESTPAFDDWLERALSRKVADRFQTASELYKGLQALGCRDASEPRPEEPTVELRNSPRNARFGEAGPPAAHQPRTLSDGPLSLSIAGDTGPARGAPARRRWPAGLMASAVLLAAAGWWRMNEDAPTAHSATERGSTHAAPAVPDGPALETTVASKEQSAARRPATLAPSAHREPAFSEPRITFLPAAETHNVLVRGAPRAQSDDSERTPPDLATALPVGPRRTQPPATPASPGKVLAPNDRVAVPAGTARRRGTPTEAHATVREPAHPATPATEPQRGRGAISTREKSTMSQDQEAKLPPKALSLEDVLDERK